MAAAGEEAAEHVEQFPPPPAFYKLYGEGGGPETLLPPPPPPPLEGEYEQYGELHTTEDGVAGLPPHIKKLYTEAAEGGIDVRGELLRLNKEVVFTFTELLHTLTESPGLCAASRMQYDTQMMSLGLLLWNMQHLLNQLRPHQARAALEFKLQEQIAERRAAIQALRQQSEQIDKFLAQAAEALVQGDGAAVAPPPSGAS
eukprot:jgi/Tetstr1/439475/TSEL_027907.t1